MKQIKGFSVGEFNFLGAFVCASERGYNFLVSPNGFSIIVSDELVECLVKQKPSEDLMMKLIQHQMASINGKQYSEPTVEINPTFFIIDITNKCNFAFWIFWFIFNVDKFRFVSTTLTNS